MIRIRVAFWFAFGLAFWIAMIGGAWHNAGMIILGVISEVFSSVIYLNTEGVK